MGPEIGCVLFVLMWVAGAVALWHFGRRRRQEELRGRLAGIARMLGGSVSDSPFWVLPVIRFALGESKAELRFQREKRRGGFQLDYQVPRRPLVCSVQPCGVWDRLTRFFRIDVVETGDAAFDDQYTTESNDAGFVRRWLTQEARSSLQLLHRQLGPEPLFRVSLGGERLRIESDRPVAEDRGLPVLVQLGNRIAELTWEALGTPVDGAGVAVQVLSVTTVGDAPASCQVCGDPIAERPVLCARCRTPHHPDCWDYIGGCSTFACQSRDAAAG